MTESKHFLIIGGGLSGYCLALQLIRKGAQVSIIDDGENHSSRVAAGMINPLVFRRMTKSWRVDDFIPYLKEFYKSIDEKGGGSMLNVLPVRRLFSSIQEHDFWIDKQERDEFRAYMHKINSEDYSYSLAKNPFGSGRVKETYCINVDLFFERMETIISAENTIIKTEFIASELKGTIYKNVPYDEIVFCQGYKNIENDWFGYLPLDPTKGEMLSVESKLLPENESLNRKCFVLPVGEGKFRIGSTYGWNDPTTNSTREGKNEILQNFSFISDEKIEVMKQIAGIRPTTRDRRPLLGTHHKYQNYHIFNGLGAKGFMLAPMISHEFSEYLLKGAPLASEVNINRYGPKE